MGRYAGDDFKINAVPNENRFPNNYACTNRLRGHITDIQLFIVQLIDIARVIFMVVGKDDDLFFLYFPNNLQRFPTVAHIKDIAVLFPLNEIYIRRQRFIGCGNAFYIMCLSG